MSRSSALLLALACLVGMNPAAASEPVVKVERGQSLWGIAHEHGVSVAALRRRNDLGDRDVIRPGQTIVVPGGGGDGTTADVRPKLPTKSEGDSWVWAKPAAWTQTQKSKAERGGINPCNTPDPGRGIYTAWDRAPSMGQMVMPEKGGVTADGRFDVIFHFHGHEPVRKEWVQVMDGAVLVAVTLGISSAPYYAGFADPGRFAELVDSVEKAVAKRSGKANARVRHVGLSSWSAGYGALAQILQQPLGRKLVDTVIVLDGMHAGYEGGRADANQLAPFIAFAQRAARGETLMFVSHSSIIPPGYASSTETASYLIHALGGKPTAAKPRAGDPMGLELLRRFDQKGLHVRGYAGNDKMDHCAHIGLIRDVLGVHVKKRWRSPRGTR